MLGRLTSCPTGIGVRRLGGDRAGEIRITRLLRHPKVTVDEMVATAAARTHGLVRGRHVLAIQDTTSLRDDGAGHSLNLHAMIALDAANGAALGVIDALVLQRQGGLTSTLGTRHYEDKQSRRWHDFARSAEGLVAHQAACVTVVADRESDIYEDFAHRPKDVHLLIRAAHDRALADGGLLFARVAAAPELGRVEVALPSRPGQKARDATLVLRAVAVEIKRPSKRPTRPGDSGRAVLPPSVPVTLVEALEIDPPAGCKPAHWRLLTTHAVTGLAAARQLTEFYRARWTIEQVFRTLKTQGFDIEAVRIADARPFQILCVAALIAAIQVTQMVQDRDGHATHPLEHAFDVGDRPALEATSASLEGKTARQKNPHPAGTIAFAAWVCARLGGWTGYYGKPGPIVIYNGLTQFRAIQRGWALGRLL